MIKWFKRLYMDDYVRKNPKRYMKRVESVKIYKKEVMVIALASNPDNLFDIIGSRELFFEYHKRRVIYILGLAKNREEAIELLQQLLMDTREGDNFVPKKYFTADKFITDRELIKERM